MKQESFKASRTKKVRSVASFIYVENSNLAFNFGKVSLHSSASSSFLRATSSKLSIASSSFVSNHGKFTSIFYISGGLDNGMSTVSESEFMKNTAEIASGVMIFDSAWVRVEKCLFLNNSASAGHSGVIYALPSNNSYLPLLKDNVFRENEGLWAAAVVYTGFMIQMFNNSYIQNRASLAQNLYSAPRKIRVSNCHNILNDSKRANCSEDKLDIWEFGSGEILPRLAFKLFGEEDFPFKLLYFFKD